MEAELRKAPASYRMSMLSRMRNYRRDVEQLTTDVVCYTAFTVGLLHIIDVCNMTVIKCITSLYICLSIFCKYNYVTCQVAV